MIQIKVTCENRDVFYKIKDMINLCLENILKDDYILVEVALNEAANNAFESTTADLVEIDITYVDNTLTIRVKDNGNGFDVGDKVKEMDEKKDDIMVEKLFDESGRGLFMMQQIMDKIEYNEKGNEVVLIKNINVQEGE